LHLIDGQKWIPMLSVLYVLRGWWSIILSPLAGAGGLDRSSPFSIVVWILVLCSLSALALLESRRRSAQTRLLVVLSWVSVLGVLEFLHRFQYGIYASISTR
jgi:predicted membrane channel-forming protein YqfA (hemolysin III family)